MERRLKQLKLASLVKLRGGRLHEEDLQDLQDLHELPARAHAVGAYMENCSHCRSCDRGGLVMAGGYETRP